MQKENLMPEPGPNDTLICKSNFVICFNKHNRIPDWAAYSLCKQKVSNCLAERSNKFIPEKCVLTACDKDYKSCGFDRGHIVPAKDMSFSKTTMKESFYYSNVAPQEPNFNRGRWKQLEEMVRNLALNADSVYIITGTFAPKSKKTIGKNRIVVPDYFFKAILQFSHSDITAAAFAFPNEKIDDPVENYLISVDSLENLTKWDFFRALPDEIENKVEKHSDIKF